VSEFVLALYVTFICATIRVLVSVELCLLVIVLKACYEDHRQRLLTQVIFQVVLCDNSYTLISLVVHQKYLTEFIVYGRSQ